MNSVYVGETFFLEKVEYRFDAVSAERFNAAVKSGDFSGKITVTRVDNSSPSTLILKKVCGAIEAKNKV